MGGTEREDPNFASFRSVPFEKKESLNKKGIVPLPFIWMPGPYGHRENVPPFFQQIHNSNKVFNIQTEFESALYMFGSNSVKWCHFGFFHILFTLYLKLYKIWKHF